MFRSIGAGSAAEQGDGFLNLKSVVERYARFAFRHLPAEQREEAVAEAVAAAFESYVGLRRRDQDPATFPAALANYAVLHVKDGRHVGGRRSSRDVLSRTAQRRRGFRTRPLAEGDGEWTEMVAYDRQTPVPDQVAFRIDFPAFLSLLSDRDRRMALALAAGSTAASVARRFGLTAGRVTQLRQRWQREWASFRGEGDAAAVGPTASPLPSSPVARV